VTAYEDRSRFRVVQTPQGFDRATLERAHATARDRAGDESAAATDDASLAVAIGETVWAVAGDDAAMKITTPRDLALAEHGLAAARRAPSPAAATRTPGPTASTNALGPASTTDARGPVSP